jgi:DNA-cytosine methyltransferase
VSIRFGSICSGIEAASVAWCGPHSPLNWSCQWTAETDPFCRDLLAHHYPDVDRYLDLNHITNAYLNPAESKYLPDIDLLVAGTPCQSFSVAGRRFGLDDPRGNVTLEWLRLIRAMRDAGRPPRWLVWENVPGVLSIDGGRTFGTILGTLAKLGYGFAYRVLHAASFGVPLRRRRVFLVGHSSGSPVSPQAVLGVSPDGRRYRRPRQIRNPCVFNLRGRSEGSQPEFGHLISLRAAAGGSSNSYIVQDGVVRRLTPLEKERVMGFPNNYTAIPGAHNSQRSHAIGNSFPVPILYWIGHRITLMEQAHQLAGAI